MKQKELKKEEAKQETQDQNILTETWVEDTKEDLEDYLEEQGVYIRQ